MKKIVKKIIYVLSFIELSLVSFALIFLIVVYLFPGLGKLTNFYQAVTLIVIAVIFVMPFWIFVFKKFLGKRFKLLLVLVSLFTSLILIWKFVLTPYKIAGGDVGVYYKGDYVLGLSRQFYSARVIPKGAIVVFRRSGAKIERIGEIVAVPGDNDEHYGTVPPKSYIVLYYRDRILVEDKSILSVVFMRLYSKK